MIKLTKPNGKGVLINTDHIVAVYVDNDSDIKIELINDKFLIVVENMDLIEDMILRDQFAMSAMNGMLSNTSNDEIGAKGISSDAYLFADEMLKQRKVK